MIGEFTEKVRIYENIAKANGVEITQEIANTICDYLTYEEQIEENKTINEEKERIKELLNNQSMLKRCIKERYGSFYFSYYNKMLNILKPQYLTRALYLCSYMNYDNLLVEGKTHHKPIYESDLIRIWNISRAEMFNTKKELIDLGILIVNENKTLSIGENFCKKGELMKNNHEYYEMLISRHKDNDLDANEIFEMEKHLASCKSCQKFRDEINSMSSILLGMSNIKVNKKPASIFNKKRIISSISSIAAALLIFGAVSTIYNNNNIPGNPNDSAKLMVADLNDSIIRTSIDDYNTEDDYAPLSSYFSYGDLDPEAAESSSDDDYNNAEISIMSAYIYYMGK